MPCHDGGTIWVDLHSFHSYLVPCFREVKDSGLLNFCLTLYNDRFSLHCYSDRRAEERAAYELERSAKEVKIQFLEIKFLSPFYKFFQFQFLSPFYKFFNFSAFSTMFFNFSTFSASFSMNHPGWFGRAEEGDGGEKAEARGGGGGSTNKKN